MLSDQKEYLEAGVDQCVVLSFESSGCLLIHRRSVLTKPVLEKSLKSMLVIADERRKRSSAPISEQPRSYPS